MYWETWFNACAIDIPKHKCFFELCKVVYLLIRYQINLIYCNIMIVTCVLQIFLNLLIYFLTIYCARGVYKVNVTACCYIGTGTTIAQQYI